MTPALKSLLLCSCVCISSVLATTQTTTCAADGETPQGSAIGCVTGEGVVVKSAPESAPQTSDALPLTPEQRPAVPPTVLYENGKLTIIAKNANLTDILRIVGEKTGASIDVPEAANERVVSQLGPGAARDVIAALLNGSHFNYVVLGNEADPNAVARVVLTAKTDHGTTSLAESTTVAERGRAMVQPRTALQQAVIQPYQELLQQQQAQQLNVPDVQQQAQAPTTEGLAAAPKEPASVSGEAGASPNASGAGGTETATVEPPPANDGTQKNANGERTPQQMLQDLYETRRQMMQQQAQQRVAQQQPPPQP